MSKLIGLVIGWALASFVSRLITALGVGFVAYSGLSAAIDGAVSYIVSSVNGIPADVLGLLGLMGFGDGLSVILSALSSAAVIFSARVYMKVL